MASEHQVKNLQFFGSFQKVDPQETKTPKTFKLSIHTIAFQTSIASH